MVSDFLHFDIAYGIQQYCFVEVMSNTRTIAILSRGPYGKDVSIGWITDHAALVENSYDFLHIQKPKIKNPKKKKKKKN